MSQVLDRPILVAPVTQRDHVQGPSTAPVTLLEYGDYECPFCRSAAGVVIQVRLLMGDGLRFAYRHFPLSQIHPHALQAAEAAEAAGAQGQFWQMHELLFAHQDRLRVPDLIGYAKTLDLVPERFILELRNHTHVPRVREDFMSGVRSGVNGTPTFFINGVRHDGGHALEDLLATLRAP